MDENLRALAFSIAQQRVQERIAAQSDHVAGVVAAPRVSRRLFFPSLFCSYCLLISLTDSSKVSRAYCTICSCVVIFFYIVSTL